MNLNIFIAEIQLTEIKRRLEYLDKVTTKKEIEFGESQRALVEYNQTLEESETWLDKAEQQTLSESSPEDNLTLPDVMAICVESSCNEERLSKLSQMKDNDLISSQDAFQSSIQNLNRLKERQEEITDWINNKTEMVS